MGDAIKEWEMRRPRARIAHRHTVALPLRLGSTLAALSAISLAVACAAERVPEQTLEVTASAYNSVPGQTDGEPDLAAWGDRLEPGDLAIAVSRDLLALGLGHGTLVRIDGLPGEYRVLDKMAARWKKKIDIYMGTDVEASRRWGRRTVTIRWTPASDDPAR